MRFIDKTEAGIFALKGEVQAEIPVSVATIKAEGSVELSNTFNDSNTSTVTSYTAIGWNKKFDEGAIKPPPVVTTIEQMVQAANQMEIDDGERLEAILVPYEDIPEYQEILSDQHFEPAVKLDVRSRQCQQSELRQSHVHLVFTTLIMH